MCSWFCQDILLWSLRWEVFPFQIQFLHPRSGSTGILGDNRMLQIPSRRHPRQSQQVRLLTIITIVKYSVARLINNFTLEWNRDNNNREAMVLNIQQVVVERSNAKIKNDIYLLCNVPWPSCYQLQTVQRQSCQVWKFDQKVQIWRCPWFLAPGPPRRPWARTCHQ